MCLQEVLLYQYQKAGCTKSTKTRPRRGKSTASCHIRLKHLLTFTLKYNVVDQISGMKLPDSKKIPARLKDPLEDSISFDQDTNFKLHGAGHALTFIFGTVDILVSLNKKTII